MAIKYFKHKLENLIIVNDIVIIHYLELNKNFVHPAETHNFWELVYVDKGSVIVGRNGEDVILNEGEIIFHKPNESHSLKSDGITSPNVFVLSFVAKSNAMNFFRNQKLTLNKNYTKFIYLIAEEGKKTFNLPYFNPEMTKMELLKNATLGGEQLIKNYLEILLLNIMRSETEKENSEVVFLRENNGVYVTDLVIKYLKENVYNKITIDQLCKYVNYNKSYVFRTFKKDTFTTIIDYFTKLKIDKAKQLLRDNKYNITQIANALSFDNPNYFTKTFKKITNYTPLQYKKIYLQDK